MVSNYERHLVVILMRFTNKEFTRLSDVHVHVSVVQAEQNYQVRSD